LLLLLILNTSQRWQVPLLLLLLGTCGTSMQCGLGLLLRHGRSYALLHRQQLLLCRMLQARGCLGQLLLLLP
jgi:hypothetical protein